MNRWNFHLSISSRYNIMYYRVLISINFKSPHAIFSSEYEYKIMERIHLIAGDYTYIKY